MVDFQKNNQSSGGDLDENGRFLFENAFCVGLFQSFYDGGDLDEHGCSSMIYLEIARGRCYAQRKFALMKNGFRWCEKVYT